MWISTLRKREKGNPKEFGKDSGDSGEKSARGEEGGGAEEVVRGGGGGTEGPRVRGAHLGGGGGGDGAGPGTRVGEAVVKDSDR